MKIYRIERNKRVKFILFGKILRGIRDWLERVGKRKIVNSERFKEVS